MFLKLPFMFKLFMYVLLSVLHAHVQGLPDDGGVICYLQNTGAILTCDCGVGRYWYQTKCEELPEFAIGCDYANGNRTCFCEAGMIWDSGRCSFEQDAITCDATTETFLLKHARDVYVCKKERSWWTSSTTYRWTKDWIKSFLVPWVRHIKFTVHSSCFLRDDVTFLCSCD